MYRFCGNFWGLPRLCIPTICLPDPFHKWNKIPPFFLCSLIHSCILLFKKYLSVYISIALSISSVQSLSRVRLFTTPWTAAHQASLSITNSQNLLKLISIELMMPPSISSPVIPFSSHLQSFPASGSFPMVSSSHQVAASASVLPMNIQDWYPLQLTG